MHTVHAVSTRPRRPGTAGHRRRSLPVLVGMLVLALVTACTGGTPSPDSSASAPTTSESAEPTPGGQLRIVAGMVDSLDPARSYQQTTWNLMRLYNRTLVTYSTPADGGAAQLVPDLATDLGTVSADGKTWTFKLKAGLAFDDGTPITSKDLKYGIERNFAVDVLTGGPSYLLNLLDKPDAPYAGPYSDSAEDKLGLGSVATPDALTIVFTLNRAYPDFRHVLAMPGAAPIPKARDTKEKYADAPASSGPYVVGKIDPVQGITLTRNKYWSSKTDAVRTALPDSIVIRLGLTQLARDQEILSGAADLDLTSAGVSPRTESRVKASSALTARADNIDTGRMRMLVLPAYKGARLSPQCRRAIAAAVDRPALVAALGGSTAAEPDAALWPPGITGGPTVADPGPTTPDAATTKACWPAGSAPLNFAVANLPTDLLVADSVNAALDKAGIAVDVQGGDPATFYADTAGNPKALASKKIAMVQVRWSADYPSVSAFLPRLADSRPANNAGANFAVLASPAVDAALDAALAPTAKGNGPWQKVAQVVADTDTYIPLIAERVVLIRGERLTGAVVNNAYHAYDLALVGVRR